MAAQVRVIFRCKRILNEAVARGVANLKGKGKHFTILVVLQLCDKFVDLCCSDWVKFTTLILQIANAFDRSHQKTFNRVDRALLSLRRNFKIKLRDANRSEFRLDNRTIQRRFVSNLVAVCNASVCKLATKLNLSVFKAALLASK